MKKKFFILLISIILLITPSIKVYADAPEIRLQINPDSLTLYPQEESDIVLTLQNDYSQDIYNMSLLTYGSVNFESSAPVKLPNKLSKGSSIAIPIHLIRNQQGYSEGKLFIELTYETLDETGTFTLHQVVTESLEILERKPSSLEEIIKIEVSRQLTTLEETQDGVIQITATNLSPFDVSITDIIPDGTKYITVLPETFDSEVNLPPYTSHVFTFVATLKNPYHIGEDPLYFTSLISWHQDGYLFNGSQIVNQPVSIEILSEQTEYLKLIGIPSFLFLPGFLFILTYLFCWKKLLPEVDLGIKVKEIEFWVLAITVTIPLIYLYRWTTHIIGYPRQFPIEFGLIDLQCLWILSLAGGILGCLVAIYIRKVKNRKIPLPEDKPLTIIHKLYFNGSGFFLPSVKKDEIDYVRFPITKIDSNKCWIIPNILYEFTQKTTDEYKSEFFDIINRDEGEGKISTAKGTQVLYKNLKYGLNRKMIILDWNKGEIPAEVDKATVKTEKEMLLLRDKSL